MSAAYRMESDVASLFSAADDQYMAMKAALASSELQNQTEAEVQRWLDVKQRELMRRLFQAFVTLCGQAQAQEPVEDSDGVRRPQRRVGRRKLESLFGTVEVERTGYTGRGLSTLYPVDASMNLPKHRYSLEVDRQLAMTASRMSFDDALEMMGRQTGAYVPKRQAEEAVQRAAKDFESFYASTELTDESSPKNLMVLTFDQKGVVLHHEDLLEATRKAAEGSRRKLETRDSKGEPRRGRKRMATVAAVYTVAPYRRRAEDIIDGLRHLRDTTAKTRRPRPEGKRVWATLTRNLKDVIADAFDEALARDPLQHRRWLVLIDGDKKLARWVRAEAQRRGVQVTLVLDFIHALEYLWRAAHVFFKEGTEALESWVLERLQRMLEGKVSQVVAGMTRMATLRGLKTRERKPIDTAARYLREHKEMMRYDKLLGIGAPIATGIIEGACRHVINDRMGLTGALWRLPSAEAVLRLRSIISSGDFDAYWSFHEAAEAKRNHLSRYANGKVPRLMRTQPQPPLRLVKGCR
jgi:hypothetical protein